MSDLLARVKTALADRYAVERELGRGGMATVFLARDPKHDRAVAIKVMGHDISAQLGGDRFLREIKTTAQLNHPNVLPLYDSGDAGGILYYVTPYVEGGSLRDRLDREGQLPIEEALEIAKEVADALSHAHSLGFVHRDIKPENILFMSGRPVVADFGIARAVSAAGGEQITQTGMAIGTPAYMSPEQAAGDTNVDGRADLYALGCVLYEMLSGHPPFMGKSPREILARHTVDAVPPLRTARPTVPENVDETIVRALAKVPADRFTTAREFADALAGRARALRRRSPTALLRRFLTPRVLGIVGAYLVIMAMGWLGTERIVDRFALSPHLPGFVLTALALLLPAVFVVAYTMGGDATRWRAVQTAGVSFNFGAAALTLVLVFGGKDLGAATRAVTLTDEEGNTVERVIPKSEFRKRVAIFYFDADPADTVAQALAYGIPTALGTDLFQDLFFDLRVPIHFRDRLREAGFRDLTGVPISLARNVAAEQFRDQFVLGSVRTEGDDVLVTMSVYETATGERVSQSTVRGTDALALVDELASDVKGTMNIPEGYRGRIRDLPAAELFTNSRTAFHHYSRAQRALVAEGDWAGSEEFLERAVAEDPTFAAAQYELFLVYTLQNRTREALVPLQAAVDHVYRLPERVQNLVKANFYEMHQQPEKAYRLIEMNAEMFPDDVTALMGLAQTQVVRGQRREAIGTFRRILELDPDQHDFLRAIGNLQEALGDYEDALQTYERYAAANPNDHRSYIEIGDLHRALGDHSAAKQAYERAQLLDPGSAAAALRLAGIELYVGAFADAVERAEATLRTSRTAADSVAALNGLARYHEYRGQTRQALRLRERARTQREGIAPPIDLIIDRFESLGDHVAAGDTARALHLLRQYTEELQPPFDAFRPFGELDIALELEDAARIDSAAAQLERVIAEKSFGFLEPNVAFARGQAHYLRGEFREAVARWQDEQRLNPGDYTVSRQLGQAYRGLGEHARAAEYFQQALRVAPADPRTQYEMALLHRAAGRRAEAIAGLRAALATWEDADPNYKWARRARVALQELEGRR